MKKKALTVAFSILALTTGCAVTSTTGQKVDSNVVSSIEKGKTTKAELVAKLGPPTGRQIMTDGN